MLNEPLSPAVENGAAAALDTSRSSDHEEVELKLLAPAGSLRLLREAPAILTPCAQCRCLASV